MSREDDSRQAHESGLTRHMKARGCFSTLRVTLRSIRSVVDPAFVRHFWACASWMTSKLGDAWLGGWPNFCKLPPT